MAKNCNAVGTKYSRNNERISRYLIITRSTGNDCMNGKCTWLPIEVYRWMGIAKAMAQVLREHHRVSSESSGAAGDRW